MLPVVFLVHWQVVFHVHQRSRDNKTMYILPVIGPSAQSCLVQKAIVDSHDSELAVVERLLFLKEWK